MELFTIIITTKKLILENESDFIHMTFNDREGHLSIKIDRKMDQNR